MDRTSSPRYEIFASTAPGLESIATGELKALGIRSRQEIGGVGFSGDLEQIYRSNLWLRTATRVIVRLGSFHASTFFELERRAKKIPWENFLPSGGAVRLRVTCRKSKLYHSDAVGERVLKAIANSTSRPIELRDDDRRKEEEDSEPSDAAEETPEQMNVDARAMSTDQTQLFVVRIVHDQCEISADTSGELLHRRGYRQQTAKAPLRETIAAAMVLASGWRPRTPLLDPMCGAGTIPIEAALIAHRMAPGRARKFQFMEWPNFDSGLWRDLLAAEEEGVTKSVGEIFGADRDAGAIAAAVANAERAGLGNSLGFKVAALSDSLSDLDAAVSGRNLDTAARTVSDPDSRGSDGPVILANPPYGVRVRSAADLRNLYATVGRAVRKHAAWRLGILTPDAALVRQTGLPLRPRFSTSNGGIPVAFFFSEKTGAKMANEGHRKAKGTKQLLATKRATRE
jgi:putative N6-adenine-specific DNA methylase